MLTLIGGSAHSTLTSSIADVLRLTPAWVNLHRYPDAELVEILDSVRGADVYIIQPTPPPPEGHLFELLLLADAARRAGAQRVTAVMPYLGYSRQDRLAGARTAIGARVVADILGTRVDRVITVDLHQPATEGFFTVPVEHIEAFPLLLEALRGEQTDAVVVAPDLGASKLADRMAKALGLPFAVVHKTRTSGVEVQATQVSGDVRGRRPVLIDDMITTGRTVSAAIGAVSAAGAIGEAATVVVTHALFAPGALDTLAALHIARLVVTDSVPVESEPGRAVETVPLAPLLAETILRLHEGRSLADLRSKR